MKNLESLEERSMLFAGASLAKPFSIAGNQLGFEDARGTLFYEIARAAEQIKPRYIFLENVRNLLSHDKGKTFTRMLKILDELGYDAEWQVLNSKNFGVPQNRERVFIIAYLRGECTYRVFPIRGKDEKFNTDGEINQVGNIGKSDNFGGNPQVTRVYDINGISPTLNTMQGGGREPKIVVPVLTPDRVEKRQNGRRFKTNGEPMFTITTQDRHGVLVREATKQGYAVADVGDSINFSHPNSKPRRGRVGKNIANTLLTSDEQGVVLSDYKIRKLTPRECWRLQGFPDWAFDKAQAVNSNSQLYKQAGNSVTVNVIEEIAKRLK